jgi:hypothetical protein
MATTIANATPQVFEIPTSPFPQQFTTQFPNGNTYILRLVFQFNEDQCWILNISDVNDNPLVSGIPLITGADLLAQYAYLGFGCSMFATTDGNPAAPPTFFNLGTTGHLRISTPVGA